MLGHWRSEMQQTELGSGTQMPDKIGFKGVFLFLYYRSKGRL